MNKNTLAPISTGSSERLLFLPGAGGDGQFWAPVAKRIDHQGEKILLDWPGFGPNPRHLDVQGLDDLLGLVTKLMDRPVDLIAQSMGGILAVRAAVEHPHQVNHLVLTATSGGVDTQRFAAVDWRNEWLKENPQAPLWFVNDRSDLTPFLSTLQVPTLLLWGDDDPISPLGVGSYLQALIPNAELRVITGGDHSFAYTHAEKVAPLIQQYLLR